MEKLFTIERGLGVFRADGSPNTDPVTVPDGKWVLEIHSHSFQEHMDDGDDVGYTPGYNNSAWRTNKVVGPEPQVRYLLDQDRNRQSWTGGGSTRSSKCQLLVGDQPFGVITDVGEDNASSNTGGRYFSCARQIHKGELGRRPQITRPQFVREAFAGMSEVSGRTGEPIPNRDRRRGKKGWARLAEVAALVGMSSEEMAWRYFAFTDAECPELPVIFGSREQIAGQKIRPEQLARFREDNLPQLFYHDPQEVWIRQGFALTILYLKHFGYEPVLPEEKATAIALLG